MPSINAVSMLIGGKPAVAAYSRGVDVASLLFPNRVRSILNKFSASAFIAGVDGVLRFGYQPGNYTDSAGTILAAANDGVGRVNDAGFGGINATQATAGFKPVLRNTSGIQSWQFDAALSQRLSLSAVPFQMSDDHCAIIGCTATALGDRYMFGIRSSSNTQPVVAAMRFTAANGIEALYRNDAGSSAAPTISGGAAVDEDMVVTARSVGSALTLRKNGIVGATATKPSGATTVNTATLGASVTTTASQFWHGRQHAAVFLVGAPSDSELLTLEKFIASLQGRSL